MTVLKRCLGTLIMALVSVAVCSVISSCDILGPADSDAGSEKGELRISFAQGQSITRMAAGEVPDTSDFHLTVTSSDGTVIYDGVYSASPEAIIVEPGSYDVKVVSSDFKKPAFSMPQFGDDRCVIVPSGEIVNVRLVCTQINCGVKLKVDEKFLEVYPGGVLFLSSKQGRLMYGYSEKRVAYFSPGDISLILNDGSSDQVLLTRNLKAQDILVLDVGVDSSAGSDKTEGRLSVAVDTTRNWQTEHYVIGSDDGKGSDPSEALTVSQAMDAVGEEGVWVSGYIVGGDLTSSSASFDAPFNFRTNILLGPRSSTVTRSSCISVQLPSGNIRDALNLVDNRNNLECKVCIKGDIVASYYGLVGLKNVTDYKFQ